MPYKVRKKLESLTDDLMAGFRKNSERKECYYKTTGKVVYDEFNSSKSKHTMDDINRAIAKHYDFTDEELDFIINYDIKYRVGQISE